MVRNGRFTAKVNSTGGRPLSLGNYTTRFAQRKWMLVSHLYHFLSPKSTANQIAWFRGKAIDIVNSRRQFLCVLGPFNSGSEERKEAIYSCPGMKFNANGELD